jgi:hypothetical protein
MYILDPDPKGDKLLNVRGYGDMFPESSYPIVVAELLLHILIFLSDQHEKIWGLVLGCLPIKPIVVLVVSLCAIG